jgi:hypothetical protein
MDLRTFKQAIAKALTEQATDSEMKRETKCDWGE